MPQKNDFAGAHKKFALLNTPTHKEGVFNVNARPYAALSYRESGTGTFKIGNKIFHTKPGDVLFIPADVAYEVEYSSSKSIVVNMDFCNYFEAVAKAAAASVKQK